ncbi:cyclodeaminase/cyclohydrolase family protein [soil metagenome]
MTERLVDRSLRAFSDELASDRPVPGGGSASAYAGALGAALGTMVARLASRKSPGAHEGLITELESLRADLLRLVDEDSAAYALVADAMKLPRSSEAERRARTERVQGALVAAAGVPLEIAKASRKLLDACGRAVDAAPAAAITDVGVGALMAETAIRGAALNVTINVAALKDARKAAALAAELESVLDGADEERARILELVESRIAR